MKLFLLAAAAFSAPALTVSELNHIKSLKPRWRAAIPKRFEGLTKDEVSSLLMPVSFLKRDRASVPRGVISGAHPPDSFDFREEYPHCIPEVVDQGGCGSCWAFSSVAAFGDRRCVAGLDKQATKYSPQYVVSCDRGDMACDGGWLPTVWRFLIKTGTTTDECVPYESGSTGARGNCPTACADGTELPIFKATRAVDYGLDCDLIMQALATGGPLQTAFTVYSDFMYYAGGVYQHVYGYVQGGHAVEMVGYGTDDEWGVDYWIIRNSWGPDWGEDGYFRIIRMTNECGIEEQVIGGLFEN